MKSLLIIAVIFLLFNLGEPRRWSAFVDDSEFSDESGCVDKWSAEMCQESLDNDRCYYENNAKYCAKTCNYCGQGCVDVKSSRLCLLYLTKGLCDKRSQAYDNCRANCGLCQN